MTQIGAAAPASPAERDHIWLTTVGVDVGSSTSHLTLSRLHLQRLSDRLSSRFVTVERSTIFRSPIMLTPYLSDNMIDADALATFVMHAYATAGITPEAVDTGAVILTGEAVKRRNARAINARLASIAGSFVATTAGPRLEALIAAHGSGSVALSRVHPGEFILNVDIGGGSTKFALVRDGSVERTGTISVGGRLVATDGSATSRIEPDGAWFARQLGIELQLGGPLSDEDRVALGTAMAAVVMSVVRGEGDSTALAPLWVTPPFLLGEAPDRLIFSGGVAQYVLERESRDFGDLGPALGAALRRQIEAAGLATRLEAPAETIRATVVGASQYTVQVSGNTVTITDPTVVPLHNLRVVSPDVVPPFEPGDIPLMATAIAERIRDHEIEDDEPFALAFRWKGVPFHSNLLALAEAIVSSVGRSHATSPLVLLLDGDVASSVGGIIHDEIGWPGPIVCLDGLTVDDFDFVDIGSRIDPAGTYPVIIKSLVYPSPTSSADSQRYE